MLMALLFGTGLALLIAFIARSMMPPPWNRYVFLGFGVPSLGLVVLGLGLAIYSYATCSELPVVEHRNADETQVLTIHTVDCGDPAARTYDVSVSFALDGARIDRTILRSHGLPAPTDVAEIGPRHFRVTMSDGSTHETTLTEDRALPDRVWSIIDGKIIEN